MKTLQPRIHIYLYKTTFKEFPKYYETENKYLEGTLLYLMSNCKDIYMISDKPLLLFRNYFSRRPIFFRHLGEYDLRLGRIDESKIDDGHPMRILWNTPDFIGDLNFYYPYSADIISLFKGMFLKDCYGGCFGY